MIDNVEHLFDFVNDLPIAIARADTTGKLPNHFNNYFISMFGWASQDIDTMDKWFANAYPDEDYRAHVLELWAEMTDEAESQNKIYSTPRSIKVSCKDGSSKWCEIIYYRKKHFVYGIFIDITSFKQTEKSLQKSMLAFEESEKSLKLIFDNAQSGLMHITGERILINANQRLADILGYGSPKEMIGLSMRTLHLSEENFVEYGRLNFDALRMGVKRYIEYELQRKDGSSIWCELSGKAIDDKVPADLSLGVLWTINDISLRKTYEFSLQKSEERYRSIFHTSRAIELIIDPVTQQIIDSNKSAENFYGYSREALHKMKISDINTLSSAQIQEEMQRAKEQKKEVFHFKHRIQDGTYRDVEVYSSSIEIEGQNYLYSIIFDISQRVDLEKREEHLQERLSFAMEGSNDGLWDWNIKTNEVFYSPRWKEILGYAPDEIQSDLSEWERLIHPDDVKFSWMELERFLASKDRKDRFTINFRMQHKNGHYVPILSRAKKVFNHKNEVERLVGTHVDMTELYTVQEAYKEERDRSELYLDTAEVLLVALDTKARITMINRKGEELLGYKEEELLGKVWFEIGLLPEDVALNVKVFFNELMQMSQAPKGEFKHHLISKNGEKLLFSFHSSLLFDDKKACIGLLSSGVDITQKEIAEKELAKQHQFLETVMNSVGDSIMVIEKDYTISMMNDEAKKNIDLKWIADPMKPKCYEVSHYRSSPCDGIEHPCPLEQTMESKAMTRVVHLHHSSNNKKQYVELTAAPLFSSSNDVEAIIESAHDITDLKQAQKSLQHQAEHDALTNLPNRMLLFDRLKQSIIQAKRTQERVAVLFIDLDHFKEINDSLGHGVGDTLLQSVAKRLLECLRESDTVARQGGDEFAIVIGHITSTNTVTTIIQNIMSTLKNPFMIENHSLYVTMSIGVAMFPEDGHTCETLLKNSDAAMYKAKHSGRDNYQYYTQGMTEQSFERIVLETQLRESLEKEQLEVYYQLQFDAHDDHIIGMEALVRWIHPDMGIVSPAKFIPLAEETGFILKIDEWVMKQALKQFKQWYELGYKPGKLSLNLSPLRLEQSDFISQLKSALLETGAQNSWLNLEITESQIMRNPDEAIQTLQEVHDLGISLAIDDFGTGYSSLSYLKRLPIDKLKIDQSFIRDIPQNNDDMEITKTIITMARGLNLDVIAEGVETIEQKEFLVENACSEIQGYFYHRPSPSTAVENFMAQHS